MEFTEDDIKEAKDFCKFYIDLLDNHQNTVKFYLSENVVLDWFGQTVKGEKNVNQFIKSTLNNVKHCFTDASPVEKIGFRESHIVSFPKQIKQPSGFLSPPRRSIPVPRTPTKVVQQPSTSSTPVNKKIPEMDEPSEKGQGDGFHNCDTPSPVKRFKPTQMGDGLEGGCVENSECTNVKFMISKGSVEFQKKSIKKLQGLTKWQRPCKLSVAYSWTDETDANIYLIIYEGTVKCRRNLLPMFSAAEAEN